MNNNRILDFNESALGMHADEQGREEGHNNCKDRETSLNEGTGKESIREEISVEIPTQEASLEREWCQQDGIGHPKGAKGRSSTGSHQKDTNADEQTSVPLPEMILMGHKISSFYA